MNREIALTAEGQTKLEEELRHLETVRRREVGERIKEAKEFGDISENSEYDDAKNEQAWVESRIVEITQILAHATIIDEPKNKHPERVTLGSLVELESSSGNRNTFRVVGSAEADPANNKISNESPVGQAIMGCKKGEVVDVNTPSGKVITYTILSIAR
ncbi:MAG: transcription elongation factor GreA [Coriobacteriia bacterium]